MEKEEQYILLQQCLDRKEAAFRKFYGLFHLRVYHLALGFFPSHEEALDATQEIFLKVFSSISTFRGESQLQTWVYTIALNYCRMEKRRQGALRRFAFLENIFSAEKSLRPELVHWEHPGIAYENRERASRLLDAVHRLPPAQRDAVLLIKYEELTYKEAAAVLQTSVSALESLISRAMANLRKNLKE